MLERDPKQTGTLSRSIVVVMVLLAGGLMFAHLTGVSAAWLAGLLTVVTEGAMAAAVLVAAGGYGHLLVRRLAPASAPMPLRVISACLLGLWGFSTVMLVVGSAAAGLLKWYLWWPIMVGGIVLAGWQGWRRLEGWRLPERFDGRVLVWVLVAVAVGLWLGGATRPPGSLSVPDEYDVLEYHLQVPREYFLAQRVTALRHNVYSFYPLSMEMLYLLAMCLRNGAYEGMYLAKLLHGALGVLAVAGVYTTLKRDDDANARFSAALLGTAPFLIYLSWLAMVELAQICCLVLALLWLREWLRRPDWRSACCIGGMLGAACAAKYLSVALIAAPVLAVMLGGAVRSLRRLGHVPLAAAAMVLLFSPWLIRNAAATDNPVFPLAMHVFGPGHWTAQCERRWADGHATDYPARPPVPEPPGYKPPPVESRLVKFYKLFLTYDLFGPMGLMLAGVAICALLAETKALHTFNAALAGVLAIQLAAWTALTWMPPRFLVPVLVPVALLGGDLLARLSRVKDNPFRRGAVASSRGPWGLAPAVAIFIAIAAINLLIAYRAFGQSTRGLPAANGARGEQMMYRNTLQGLYLDGERPLEFSQDVRFLLLGEAKAFYMPPGSIYATAFDDHPLAVMLREGLTGEQIVRRLRDRGVTHVWIDWAEIWRLARSYGFDEALSGELFERFEAHQPPDLAVLRQLRSAGARPLELNVNEPLIDEMMAGASEKDRATVKQSLESYLLFAASVPWAPGEQPRLWPRLAIYALPEGPRPGGASGPPSPPGGQ